MTARTTTLLGLCVAMWAGSAAADDAQRPSEDDIFGGGAFAPQPSTSDESAAPKPAFSEHPTPPPSPSGTRDDAELNAPHPERDAFASGEAVDNPLAIGGLFYQQMIVSKPKSVPFTYTSFDMPLQFDGFFDVRPNSRLRGFIDMRLLYDPARNQYGLATAGDSLGSLQTNSTATAPTGVNFTTQQVPNNPQAVLNEAWIKFDILRTVFVTAGKQHIKWGASRYWNPTDFLNPTKRDPLMPYDLRLGTTMVKFEVPLETNQTNFYAVALFENPNNASTLGQLGGALRGETLLGDAELGVDMVWRKGYSPVLGADFSAPVGPIDVYVEGNCYLGETPALLNLVVNPEDVATNPNGTPTTISSLYSSYTRGAGTVQISGGTHYDFAWLDNRQATIGVEYFYNQLGYDNPDVYPLLILLGKYLPFYTGHHYAAVYVTGEGPDEFKHTSFTLSGLGNLSDESFITRIDFSWRLLTYLTFAAYADAHLGTSGGEFNFSFNTRDLKNPLSFGGTSATTIPAVFIPPTIFDIGMSLRLSF